jgi:hypothetical protein
MSPCGKEDENFLDNKFGMFRGAILPSGLFFTLINKMKLLHILKKD